MTDADRQVLPGFSLTLGYTVFYLSILVLLPIAACFFKAASLSVDEFWGAVWTERARAAYLLTFGAALVAAVVNLGLGLLLAWVLIRYEFPGKKLVDSLVDLPLALPTAVGGLVYSALYVQNGWLGRYLVPLGIHGAYTRLGIVLVLVFVGGDCPNIDRRASGRVRLRRSDGDCGRAPDHFLCPPGRDQSAGTLERAS
jgi:sulfate transport system permease protein